MTKFRNIRCHYKKRNSQMYWGMVRMYKSIFKITMQVDYFYSVIHESDQNNQLTSVYIST